MRLCEEYVQRHAIQVPMVKHVQSGNVFYRENGLWVIKQIDWQPPEVHPGSYLWRTFRVNRNGFERGRFFERVEEKPVQWDEYEPYLLEWASVPRDIPRSPNEVIVASWLMLLYCWDKALMRHIHMDALGNTLDTDLSVEERCNHIQTCVDYLSRTYGDCHRLWTGDLNGYRERYSIWLAQMVPPCK